MTSTTDTTTKRKKTSADASIDVLRARLVAHLQQWPSALIALSGGVDSSVVAAASAEALGSRALAVTGVSASLPSTELDAIGALCARFGLLFRTIETRELDDPRYVENSPERCYFCKHDLFSRLGELARRGGFAVVLDGTHAGDVDGHRPGRRAGRELGVRSPLYELGLGKDDVRALARAYDLPNADRPASPCTSSRIAYGVEVTSERLARVQRAERLMHALGFLSVRVRLQDDRLARIEVPAQDLGRAAELASLIHEGLRELGFVYVTLDLGGLRSGSLLEVLA